MSTALITGVTGQDGFYLAKLLLEKGYRVIGTSRDIKKAQLSLAVEQKNRIELVEWDMLNEQCIKDILSKYCPAEVYNFAAFTSGINMFDNPVGVAEINGLAVARILESIRTIDRRIKFCQASSREIYGEAIISPQNELTQKNPRNPYGAAKLYADNLIQIYRKNYGLFACSAILFNHESPLRGLNFVTRKITHEAAKIKLGLVNEIGLGNLDARRDWGFAGDYVRAMWLMLQHKNPDDYVVSTGVTHSVADFCELAFSHLSLDYRDYVREDISSYRPHESALLVGCADKAKIELKWKPDVSFKSLVHMMVDADLNNLGKKL